MVWPNLFGYSVVTQCNGSSMSLLASAIVNTGFGNCCIAEVVSATPSGFCSFSLVSVQLLKAIATAKRTMYFFKISVGLIFRFKGIEFY